MVPHLSSRSRDIQAASVRNQLRGEYTLSSGAGAVVRPFRAAEMTNVRHRAACNGEVLLVVDYCTVAALRVDAGVGAITLVRCDVPGALIEVAG